MLILAVETSTQQGSVALGEIDNSGATVLVATSWLRKQAHGEFVTPNIEELFKTSGLKLSDVSALAVDIGPGSFTGIRVGLNIIKSLSYALSDKPIYTFNSLELLAYAIPFSPSNKAPTLALINAHKSQCYLASFSPTKSTLKTKLKPQAMTVEKMNKTIKTKHICVGEGYTAFENQLSKGLKSKLLRISGVSDYPHASTMIQLLGKNIKKARPKTWTDVEALYIRGSEAEEKLKAGTLKPLPEY